ncbi:hypothetical protein PCE31106_00109 [Pandoraea cepalis]|uniref:Uncharacterized protein n=1 Tax=Pandoraea cepalis TaxID=2508294 RepID=A0A5E4REM1_9BURK|nr:hypothetical protein [Pandoraea cepalis]VVD61273.1 hypothetical protein PCE31106_00109 [Pandoraea cepalis]
MRRFAILAVSLLFATAAHAGGNLAFSIDRAGQLSIDGQAVGVPIGTAFDHADGDVTIAQALRDPTGETLNATVRALVVHGNVVSETVTVRDAHTERVRVELHPDRSATVRA